MFGLILRRDKTRAEQVIARLQRRMPQLRGRVERQTRLEDVLRDSLDVVELLCAVEDEFGVRLSAGTFARARTMGKLARLIERRAPRERLHHDLR